jgi:hypothetical protein
MEFLKKHYEKVLLGVVLVGLAVAVAFVPLKIASERQALEDKTTSLLTPQVKQVPALELGSAEATLKSLAVPSLLDLSSTNKLFHPMPWQKANDGKLLKVEGGNIGPKAVTVTKITPLYSTFTLDTITTSDGAPRYIIGIQREAATDPNKRGKKQEGCSLKSPADDFSLVKVEGTPDAPTSLTLELKDTHEQAVLTKNQSFNKDLAFRRIDGYKADLKYEPEKKTWPDRRAGVGSPLLFNGEDYKIVAINASEVIIMSPNQKKWPIPYNANP